MMLTYFYVIAAAMVILLAFVLLKSLFDPSLRDETNHQDVNVGIAKDRRSLVKDALSKGHIDQATHDAEVADIETTLASELADGPNSRQSSAMRGVGALIIVGSLIAVSASLYQRLGSSISMDDEFLAQTGSALLPNGATVPTHVATAVAAGMDPNEAAKQAPPANTDGPGALSDLIPQLEARLIENPDDKDGWALLGRTYMNIGEFKKAEEALAESLSLDDQQPAILVMHAESIALQRDGDLTGEPITIINKALCIHNATRQPKLK